MNTQLACFRRLAGGLGMAILATLAGCRPAPRPESRRAPAAQATVQALGPPPANFAPAAGDCGLAAYPASRSTREIVADAPPAGAQSANSMMLAKVEIGRDGRVTHLRVLRLAHPQVSNAASLNEQAVDMIKQWRYAPAIVAGKPEAVCGNVAMTLDLR